MDLTLHRDMVHFDLKVPPLPPLPQNPIQFYSAFDTNFSNHPVVYDKRWYPTGEHIFQVRLFLFFHFRH
jgi:hypothetical protein